MHCSALSLDVPVTWYGPGCCKVMRTCFTLRSYFTDIYSVLIDTQAYDSTVVFSRVLLVDVQLSPGTAHELSLKFMLEWLLALLQYPGWSCCKVITLFITTSLYITHT